MPFGPTNAPTFYSAMTSHFKYEWDTLFIIRVKALSYINGETVRVTESFEVFVGKHNVTSGTKTIIYCILLYCSKTWLLLLHLECICIILRKYRDSFCLDKCEFLKDQTEYVGHDITLDSNCLVYSKLDMIND